MLYPTMRHQLKTSILRKTTICEKINFAPFLNYTFYRSLDILYFISQFDHSLLCVQRILKKILIFSFHLIRPKKKLLRLRGYGPIKRVGRSGTNFFFLLIFCFTCHQCMCSLGDCYHFDYNELVSKFKIELIQCFGSFLLKSRQ